LRDLFSRRLLDVSTASAPALATILSNTQA